ncbi:MAG: zinc ribbon domain-containing protein [bacterium]|nr:zinc ribbon domain-containing protein [Gammaproteobacteria bacterium]
MPIYEYQCESCDHRLEKLQKLSDEPLKECPSCRAETLKKLVSAAAFRLKGSGWYETDFKTGKKKNVHGGSEGTESKSTAGGDSSSSNSSVDSSSGKSEKKSSAKSEGKSSSKASSTSKGSS